ncbi:hypothetical protein AMJ71_06110 [candidate division TA06 bacterium SM1_40]|uniref:Uncharacterized protein n=1 Tax=candidate division TA06 bacterium SM1_40 TaxID=1703773 RepID=A0A0S8JK00_UNCT6|nr:MAG: hypothetical protein AMJ71_06110 [candidate division TA06 bacterium SM1_40]
MNESSELQTYEPFMPLEAIYEQEGREIVRERISAAFANVLGLPRGVISTAFKSVIDEVLKEEYPRFRCSSLRAIVEGRVPGVPIPVVEVSIGWKKRLLQALTLMDFFETILARYIEGLLDEQRADIRKQIETVTGPLGGAKIPRVTRVILEGEKPKKR